MLQLLGAKLRDIGGKLGIVIAQFVELALVVPVDFGLDCFGAGHRRFLANQRRSSTQRKAGNPPDRLEQGWAHSPLRHQLVEPLEVTLLLHRHSRHSLRRGRIGTQYGELAGIYSGRAIFACLVDTKHGGAVRSPLPWPPRAGHRARPDVSVSQTTATAPESEMIAFQPAMEMPRNDHWT